MNISPVRLAAALGLVLAWLGLCLALWRREKDKRMQTRREADALRSVNGEQPPLLLAYASQTGAAEELAWRSARLLHSAGEAVQVLALNDVTREMLQRTERALFIASTYGEGDPPDNAALFVGQLMREPQSLPGLHYGLLALGDRQYTHFCGFGRALDSWLQASSAQRLFERLEMDQAAGAVQQAWQQALSQLANIGEQADWQAPAYADWTLVARELLNPGSLGQPIYRIDLTPPAGSTPHWESGDLVQVLCPEAPGRPRDYSVASLPGDAHLTLLVRQQLRADGSPGLASHWLCQDLPTGAQVPLRLRVHRPFRLGDNAARPLILIGNGSGLAGLSSHLKAREAAGAGPNWLIFGERQAAHDRLLAADMERWQASGLLTRCDLVFSRDQSERRYVQHSLRASAARVQAWLASGAAIYVCGSLQGMAAEVDDALREIAGSAALDQLAQQGRYRRDVY